MKNLSKFLFIVLIGSICLIQTALSQNPQQCVKVNPVTKEKVFIDCPMVPYKKELDSISTSSDPNDMFIINFDCTSSDKVLCDKVKNVFVTAGKFITATINLQTPVVVNATFTDLCQMLGGCSVGRTILGAAGPSMLVPKIDQDGKTRLYPQAIYKQLGLRDQHPAFQPFDILALFNSQVKYWFEGDPPLLDNKVDMLYVVLHELIHGLGFTTAWDDYANLQILTPMPGPSLSDPSRGEFLELESDRLIVLLPSGQPLTSITDELNQFQFSVSISDNQFISLFRASPQFPIAQDMFKRATTQGTMGFLLNPSIPRNTTLTPDQIKNDVLILETSLNPYQQGSSVGHEDMQSYLNTSDFLMIYTYPKKRTLGQVMAQAGSTNTTGPIGPRLRRVLKLMGYQINDNYTPPVTLSSLQTSDSTTNTSSTSNPTSSRSPNSSSFVNVNLGLSFICLLLALTYNINFNY